jgi:hypothetical protein
MASADEMERERRRLAFLEYAASQGFGGTTPVSDIPIMTEAAGPITQPKPDGSFWGNIKGLGSMLYNTGASLVPGTQQSQDLSNLLQTSPQDIPLGVLKSFASTGSNLVDVLPYVDTKEPGINYINDYREGKGFTTALEDILNLLAVGATGKAVNAGATARMGVTPTELFASRLGIAPAAASKASLPNRLNVLYEFMRNPDRLDAINNLPLPSGVEPPVIVIPSDRMMNILDDGYGNMFEGGQRYVEDPAPAYRNVDEDYSDMREIVEEDLFGGQRPVYGLSGQVDIEKRAPYGGFSYNSPEYGGNVRFGGSFWEVKPRLNRPMTMTPSDTFAASAEDVSPYLRERIIAEDKLRFPDTDYNEVQIYGGRIPPEDLMEFSLNIIEPQAYGGINDSQALAMVNQNLDVVKRLADDNQALSMKVYNYDRRPDPLRGQTSGFGQIKLDLTGQDVVDYLIEQRNIIQERIRRTER